MSRRILALAGLLAVGACAAPELLLDKGPGTGTLIVEFRGLEHEEGQVLCALFGTPEGFPTEPAAAERTAVLEVDATGATWTLENLATGLWAIAAFHDEDGDGAMGTNWMGRPTEAWGVSNGARGTLGLPSFVDAAFDVIEGRQRFVVNLAR